METIVKKELAVYLVAGENTQTQNTKAQNSRTQITQTQNTKAQNSQTQITQTQNTQRPKIAKIEIAILIK